MSKRKAKGWAITFNANTPKEETIHVPVNGPVRALRKARKKVTKGAKATNTMITLLRL
jgi:hypothetical protein